MNQPVAVQRDAYEGEVADVNAATAPPAAAPSPAAPTAASINPVTGIPTPQKVDDRSFHGHQTRSGVRNMQDSSFALSGK